MSVTTDVASCVIEPVNVFNTLSDGLSMNPYVAFSQMYPASNGCARNMQCFSVSQRKHSGAPPREGKERKVVLTAHCALCDTCPVSTPG